MRKPRSSSVGFLATLLVCGCANEALEDCKPTADARVVCGVQNPEDLAVLPGGGAILVSEFGSMDEDKPGAIAWLDIASDRISPLFPQGGPGVEPILQEGPDWGDARCPGPPDRHFNPHGIDLQRRADGALELFVVSHAPREAIELFEVDVPQRALRWRGCVPAPAGSFLNDVAALPDDGFATTHMFPKGFGASALWQMARATFGADTGYVLTWHPGGKIAKLSGSDAPFPNGIAASDDGKTLFVNSYMGNEVRKLELPSGKLLGKAHVQQPDNITWTEANGTGSLLVASHVAGLAAMSACGKIERGACSAEFAIIALDPKTMRTRQLLRRKGPPMGAATVAVIAGDSLFLGSYKSDRLLRMRASRPPAPPTVEKRAATP